MTGGAVPKFTTVAGLLGWPLHFSSTNVSVVIMQCAGAVCLVLGLAFWALLPDSSEAQVKNFAEKMPKGLAQPQLTTGAIQKAPQALQQQPVQLQVQPRVAMPRPDEMLALIRTTIIALNQANQTGNYTVLRDLAAPDLRNANDASRLGLIFQVLREQAIDLTPLLLISPEVSESPAIDAKGFLRLAGYFPTDPLRVNFDMSFQLVESRWRPFTISVFLARPEPEPKVPALTAKR